MKKDLYLAFEQAAFWADFSFVDFPEGYLGSMADKANQALASMEELEGGSIANPDERRMVGHYWLRAPQLAPNEEISSAIRETNAKIKNLAKQVHQGELHAPVGPFTDLLVIGIGGSALGPQFVGKALGHPCRDKLAVHFFDNTDPDGIDLTLAEIGPRLATTLALVISKSGGTPRPEMECWRPKRHFRPMGWISPNKQLQLPEKAAGFTNTPSGMAGWISSLWDWVGGRTSETAAVGLLPPLFRASTPTNSSKGRGKWTK